MWRGSEHDFAALKIIEPSKHERVSANTSNVYTLLIDNLRSWSEYPKRSRSIICSTSAFNAAGYGVHNPPHQVFPEDGAKIGVAPRSDIWNSFEKGLSEISVPTLPQFNELILTLAAISRHGLDEGPGFPVSSKFATIAKNVSTFEKLTTHIDHLETVIEAEGGVDKFVARWHDLYHSEKLPAIASASIMDRARQLLEIYKKRGSLMETIEYLLSPEKNGFRLATPATLREPRDETIAREVWTDARSLLIVGDAEMHAAVEQHMRAADRKEIDTASE
jgi:hypothetical protein